MLANINSDVVMIWLVVALLGTSTTGVFAACMAVVALSNPFILGIGHFLTPRIVQAFASGPRASRRAVVGRVTGAIGAAMGCFCLVVMLFGDELLRFLYGVQYGGHAVTVVVLALGVTASALGLGASNALWACDRPDLNFRASLIGMTVMLVLMPVLAIWWGLPGVAVALLLGRSTDSAIRMALFLRLTAADKDSSVTAPAPRPTSPQAA